MKTSEILDEFTIRPENKTTVSMSCEHDILHYIYTADTWQLMALTDAAPADLWLSLEYSYQSWRVSNINIAFYRENAQRNAIKSMLLIKQLNLNLRKVPISKQFIMQIVELLIKR